MKKILAIATIVLAVTPFSVGETRHKSVNAQQMIAQPERDYGRKPSAIKVAENASQCALTFITESLPDFPLGTPANFKIEVCCGTPPYHFEVVQGTLPAGLHLNQNGVITGKPREEADTTVFVTVTDNGGCSLTQAFPVRVVPA